ncbi:unnamed protein product [Brassicogethes aeneus]|uniref:C-type lectin domain-containing protein n=1 Tax=Brassicogethes aeneus TaxID=1431903 RepID=A0A9P0B833_BRAAE|nr:unnamed protein product [Brassicogethes aeneus]
MSLHDVCFSSRHIIVILSFIIAAHARAVNISNTWMLPEEGFPVFYRHFRDRISWYEADAVCQFHHGNLVTADTTSQYDAIRAYLKELDVTSDVWIGLSRTSEKKQFTWSNYRELSGNGYWQDSIPVGNNPLCVVMDPSSDFLWKTMPCGGPDAATFVCELPIPDWATGPQGCLITEVPSLTILYIPEHSAVELTADCGLDGTKRISCKGKADRDEILKQLTCTITQDDDFDDKFTRQQISSTIQPEISQEENTISSKTTIWIWTSNTISLDYGIPTRHRRETEDTLSPASSKSTTSSDALMKKDVMNTTEMPQSAISKFLSTVSSSEPSVSTEGIVSIHFTSTPTSQTKTETQETIVETIPTRSKYDLSSTVETNVESGTSGISTEQVDHSGAINQGQLFSIIENGTMIDFIELSEPGQHETKINESDTTPQEYASTSLTILNTTPILPIKEKKVPKEEKFAKKTQVPTKKQINKTATKSTSDSSKQNRSKEIEMLPVVHDTSEVLNRTFRKSLPQTPQKEILSTIKSTLLTKSTPKPKISEEVPIFPIIHDTSEVLNRTFRKEVPQMPTKQTMNLTLVLTGNFDEKDLGSDKDVKPVEITASVYKKQLPSQTNKSTDKILTKDDSETMMLLNNKLNVTVVNNTKVSIPVEDNNMNDNSSRTYDYGDFSESFANNSLISEPGKVPNRQRHLTRPQRRQFYPYFFSRVLG